MIVISTGSSQCWDSESVDASVVVSLVIGKLLHLELHIQFFTLKLQLEELVLLSDGEWHNDCRYTNDGWVASRTPYIVIVSYWKKLS